MLKWPAPGDYNTWSPTCILSLQSMPFLWFTSTSYCHEIQFSSFRILFERRRQWSINSRGPWVAQVCSIKMNVKTWVLNSHIFLLHRSTHPLHSCCWVSVHTQVCGKMPADPVHHIHPRKSKQWDSNNCYVVEILPKGCTTTILVSRWMFGVKTQNKCASSH